MYKPIFCMQSKSITCPQDIYGSIKNSALLCTIFSPVIKCFADSYDYSNAAIVYDSNTNKTTLSTAGNADAWIVGGVVCTFCAVVWLPIIYSSIRNCCNEQMNTTKVEKKVYQEDISIQLTDAPSDKNIN